MLVKRAEMAPIECVVRVILAVRNGRHIAPRNPSAAFRFPRDCKRAAACPSRSSRRPPKRRPVMNETFLRAHGAVCGIDVAGQLRDLTLAIYKHASAYAESRGIILADTKFESL